METREGLRDWRKSRSIDPAWANPNAPPVFQCDEHLEAFITAVYPGPHRCNPRLDDFILGFFRLPPKPDGTFGAFMKCNRSEVGAEPTMPFKFLVDDYFTEKAESVEKTRHRLREHYRNWKY
jgi:hypothetical protein